MGEIILKVKSKESAKIKNIKNRQSVGALCLFFIIEITVIIW